ncbi:hypothetical protein [Francisella sp. XLW-1]|uniref:hypothetical protein n=1 Tax=Francisella sp. XLW-1 TaxID=2610887 RepID=UPI00123E0D02|nr:hypothetical protein [Francisella sp. XLW-1]
MSGTNNYFLTQEESLQKANDILIRMLSDDTGKVEDAKDSSYVNRQLDAQHLDARTSTDSSHYSLNVEPQTFFKKYIK